MVIDVASDPCFISFGRTIDVSELPQKFTFPFYYQPHPLCIEAVSQLQQYIDEQQEWDHNFGLNPQQKGLIIGKMFGVLVVAQQGGEIGYLTAFSGKLAGKNNHPIFVPPIFDMLNPDGFFIKGEDELNAINRCILNLEQDVSFNESKLELQLALELNEREIKQFRRQMKENKAWRQQQRVEQQTLLAEGAYQSLCNDLIKQSYRDQFEEKQLLKKWREKIDLLKQVVSGFEDKIAELKEERKSKSGRLQKRLFDQYNFLNIEGESKNVLDIFAYTAIQNPPSGAGECATPKLLQYAFTHGLKPLAMAEFWWGQSPTSEIRKHKHFYPACRGKCEPILAHMLAGMEVDENPMLHQADLGANIVTVYEDEHIVVVNKPAEFLSVPGKNISESVYSIMRERYPHATGPLLVHRLDMSTSGLLLVAKTKEAHQNLQSQFIKKTINKRYVALLNGEIGGAEGIIDLPLRVDLDNRPHQLVCYEHGKVAKTKWELIGIESGKSRVYFYPITGRTHQLRVHAAHPLGLNTAIVGDDLYGTKQDRLHLHAEYLEIRHPATKQRMSFQVDADF